MRPELGSQDVTHSKKREKWNSKKKQNEKGDKEDPAHKMGSQDTAHSKKRDK